MKKPVEPHGGTSAVQVLLSPVNVWRSGLAVAAVVAVVLFLHFMITDAGPLVAMLVMAWFLSLAMEPAVRRLSRRMPRGRATLLVMALFILAFVLFLVLFGSMFVQQVAVLLKALPGVVTGAVDWLNARLDTRYEISDILDSLNLTPQQAAEYAQGVLGGVLGLLGTVTGAVFNMFTLLLLTFYFSADGPRLRRWIAQLLPGRLQQVFISVWDVSTIKTGGYVSSRLILAAINGTASALVFLALGMPSWLALGAWTGLVAQLVPTIGTYISIALPVVVGLVSSRPWIGLAALAWGVLYQQVENLTLEPKISSRAVDIHPGVSFAAVILGASLFGAMGALLAIPVAAMLLSLVDTFVTRQELQEATAAEPPPPAGERGPAPPK
ncbi:AI-2E family transporter [Planomonospora parontospora]|uniref:AI-2E family transporter n=1 Tax=Planomonospora parontospora TaxID=58119 RepID=UPI0019AF2048|nr:AI-2E family transporter [Planomonospora parontospora]GGL15162.1 AI-2E family transporter [Planomonospora parontospora subsp. antibiotica]GII15925.1 AI-2E family transporter [Planomonospora parontospora subsp. antibiotica]